MEKQNDNIRERLLAQLPQPENLAAYREETASLLAKHEKALFWERMPPIVASVGAMAIVIAHWDWAQKTGAAIVNQTVWFGVGILVCRRCSYRAELPDQPQPGRSAEGDQTGSVAGARTPGIDGEERQCAETIIAARRKESRFRLTE